MSQEIDLENMPLEELRKLANDQPRDEQGRFTSSEEGQPQVDEQSEGQTEEVDEIVYRRVIDLGDGSGTQVFEADTPEGLIEKLAEAQTHATRKIREQAAALKAKDNPVVEPNADEEFVISQQFLQSPTKAFRDLFKRTTGMTVEEFNQQQAETKALTQTQKDFNAGQEFVQLEPNYFPTAKNGQKIEKWIRMNQLPATIENIRKAYEDLTESGLLETKPSTPDADQDGRTGQPRIAEPTTRVVGQRRAASGLSSRGSAAPAARSQELTEQELYDMPLEKLEALARAAARQR